MIMGNLVSSEFIIYFLSTILQQLFIVQVNNKFYTDK